ncbi:MAG: FAD-dependent oxidoreductase [Gemmatimonadaceae bacterium]
MTARTAIVVGGGFAGVAAAVALRARGIAVTLLEERPVLGGRARSDGLGEDIIDVGAQLVSSGFTRTVRLLAGGDPEAAGRHGLRATPGRDVFVGADAARHAIEFGSVRSMLGFRGLGALEKLKLGRHLLPLLAAQRGKLDAWPVDVPASLDRESARGYLAEHVGERAADALVEPVFNAFYAARGREMSLAFYLTLGKYGSDGRTLTTVRGWSDALARALARAGVHAERDARVSVVERDAGGVLVRTETGAEWRADGVVIATGARVCASLLRPLRAHADSMFAWLEAIELRTTWTVAVAMDAPAPREAFGILQHPASARAVSACAVHGAKFGADAPADRDVILAWPTPDAAIRLGGRPTAEIVAAMMPEVEHLVPAVRGRVTRVRLYRFDEGTPLARPGYLADRTRGRALATALTAAAAEPVALAGDYLATPTVEGAVASGEWAAGLLAAKLARS